MHNPELLTAYVIAGSISAAMLFTAFKIVRSSGSAQQSSKRSA
jgi:multisubunit Na+/H+ antiporter MnhC subunit